MAEKDFHYYCIDALAKQAGIDDENAFIIAFSSQYVDDCNDIDVEVARAKYRLKLNASEPLIRPIVTQAVSLDALNHYVQRYVLMPFHFLPGDDKKNPVICTANSVNAKGVINEAIKRYDAYAMGIALHSYADTFFHENFTPFEEDHNEVMNWKTLYRAIVPDIGHADVGNLPDEIQTIWYDYRMPKETRRIENKAIAMQALMNCFKSLEGYKKRRYLGRESSPSDWKNQEEEWLNWTSIENHDDRIEYIVRNYGTKKYSRDDHEYHDFGFPHFQMAAKKQLSLVLENCKI